MIHFLSSVRDQKDRDRERKREIDLRIRSTYAVNKNLHTWNAERSVRAAGRFQEGSYARTEAWRRRDNGRFP